MELVVNSTRRPSAAENEETKTTATIPPRSFGYLRRKLDECPVWQSFLLRIDDELKKTLPPPNCGGEETEDEDELECDSDLGEGGDGGGCDDSVASA